MMTLQFLILMILVNADIEDTQVIRLYDKNGEYLKSSTIKDGLYPKDISDYKCWIIDSFYKKINTTTSQLEWLIFLDLPITYGCVDPNSQD